MSTTTLRTTAILKTDLAGSTPRFRELPEADLAGLLREHRALLARIAAAHDGHIVKPEGDGFWLAFPSVTAAALAAMSMQEELRFAQANKGDARLSMRIVVALGDVLHQEGAVVGDAVVLATRIEAVTPPDEIYLSAAAWLSMNHAEVRTSFVNAFPVKGFAEPVAVYRIEQTHRTRVISDQYIVVTDLKGFTRFADTASTTTVETLLDGLLNVITEVCHEFGGVVRFSAGDAYCLTFTDPERAMAGLEQLVATWRTFTQQVDLPCRISIAVHKGTLYAFRSYLHGRDLNLAFNVEGATAPLLKGNDGIAVTGRVRDDLKGTPWDARLDAVPLEAHPARLKEIGIYRVRIGVRDR
jgi:class 3 adenylate cyclase